MQQSVLLYSDVRVVLRDTRMSSLEWTRINVREEVDQRKDEPEKQDLRVLAS